MPSSVQLYSGDFQNIPFPLPFTESLKSFFFWYLLKESCQTPEEKNRIFNCQTGLHWALGFPTQHCPYGILYLWILFLLAETPVFTCFSKSLGQHFALLLQLRKDYWFLYAQIFVVLETRNIKLNKNFKRRIFLIRRFLFYFLPEWRFDSTSYIKGGGGIVCDPSVTSNSQRTFFKFYSKLCKDKIHFNLYIAILWE